MFSSLFSCIELWDIQGSFLQCYSEGEFGTEVYLHVLSLHVHCRFVVALSTKKSEQKLTHSAMSDEIGYF